MDADKFVAGLHVLVVDDDRVCLTLIAKQLRLCNYKVTTVLQPEMALDMLRARRDQEDQFDIVITDVHMPGMDGFKLLELIGLEMDIPVIMLSANDTFEIMVKGLQHGACDYLVKPVRVEDLKPIWKHVVRKDETSNFTNNSNDKDNSQSEMGGSNHTMKISRKTKRHEDIAREDNGNTSISKRKRIQWSGELHRKFVRVVDHIGIHKAVPKKILDMMNVEGLTRDHIASHLQKYRLYLKKISDGTFMNSTPFTESVWSQGNSLNVNGEEHFEHIPENGIYQPSPFSGFSSSSNPFARMNSPAAFGTHSLLPTQSIQLMTQRDLGIPLKDIGPVGSGGNMPPVAVLGSQQGPSNFTSAGNSNTSTSFPSDPYGNSFATMSNGPLNTSNTFEPYANLCNYEGTTRDIPFDGYQCFKSLADGEMLPPSSDFPLQPPESAAPFGVDGSINSVYKGASATAEAGPSQKNRSKINRLSRFAALTGHNSEFHHQMASITRAPTQMASFSNAQGAPLFNIRSNSNSIAMTTDNFPPGGTSSAISSLPNLQMNTPTMRSQMLNGWGEGGSLPEQDSVVNQQVVGDQLSDNIEPLMATNTVQNGPNYVVDDFFGDWLNQDALKNYGTFMDGNWEFAP